MVRPNNYCGEMGVKWVKGSKGRSGVRDARQILTFFGQPSLYFYERPQNMEYQTRIPQTRCIIEVCKLA